MTRKKTLWGRSILERPHYLAAQAAMNAAMREAVDRMVLSKRMKDGTYIMPQTSQFWYGWGHSAPRRIGDDAVITVEKEKPRSKPRRVFVRLLPAEDGTLWLVELKR